MGKRGGDGNGDEAEGEGGVVGREGDGRARRSCKRLVSLFRDTVARKFRRLQSAPEFHAACIDRRRGIRGRVHWT